jgi:hypothetical protein
MKKIILKFFLLLLGLFYAKNLLKFTIYHYSFEWKKVFFFYLILLDFYFFVLLFGHLFIFYLF